jgi:AcrR family transcriptional regulator
MSPYPSQTNRAGIIETARQLIERDGVEALSLGKVAAALDIKAPSLYRHIRNKNALLQAVIEQTYLSLFAAYDEALDQSGDDPAERLLNLSRSHRRFAHENPNTYMLAYTTPNPELNTNPDMLLERAISIQEIMSRITGEENSLPALRGSLALVHGYVMLELNGQFRRGGDLAATFDAVLEAYLRGWENAPASRKRRSKKKR